VIAAATYSFKRVIGVELSGVLVEEAERNASRMRYRRADNVELPHGDA